MILSMSALVLKETASVDPKGYPLLYAGQGLNDTNGRKGPFRYRIFDLIQKSGDSSILQAAILWHTAAGVLLTRQD